MRLFTAILFNGECKRGMAGVQARLRTLGRGSFTRAENLHLTLNFLGETAPSRVPDIERAMDGCDVPELELVFDHAGRFRRDGGDVWWIGLRKNPGLEQLHAELSTRLRSAGFKLEDRSFSPHITLARRLTLPVAPDPEWLMGRPFSMRARTVSLMLSERTDGRLTYTEIYRTTHESG